MTCQLCNSGFVICKNLCRNCYQRNWRKDYKAKSFKLVSPVSMELLFLRKKYSNYKKDAKIRELDFCITLNEFKCLFQGNCYYCGKVYASGIDRYENAFGYILSNLVSCCKFCNYAKLTWSASFFIDQCRKISDRFQGRLVPPTIASVVENNGRKNITAAEFRRA